MGIGKRLKEAREAAGLTQEELGKLVGVTGSAITNYEKEVSHPKEPVMYALFETLQVEPNFLFQDCVTTIKSPGPLRPREETLLTSYRQLNDEGQEKLVEYADDLVQSGKYIKSNPSLLGQEA